MKILTSNLEYTLFEKNLLH